MAHTRAALLPQSPLPCPRACFVPAPVLPKRAHGCGPSGFPGKGEAILSLSFTLWSTWEDATGIPGQEIFRVCFVALPSKGDQTGDDGAVLIYSHLPISPLNTHGCAHTHTWLSPDVLTGGPTSTVQITSCKDAWTSEHKSSNIPWHLGLGSRTSSVLNPVRPCISCSVYNTG